MRVFRQATTVDPQAPAGPFSGRQAEHSKAERMAEERQASERVNQQRMSRGAVQSRAPERERERGGVFVCVSVCVAALAMCATVSPPLALEVAELNCAETGWAGSLPTPQTLDRLSAA